MRKNVSTFSKQIDLIEHLFKSGFQFKVKPNHKGSPVFTEVSYGKRDYKHKLLFDNITGEIFADGENLKGMSFETIVHKLYESEENQVWPSMSALKKMTKYRTAKRLK